jgi:SAM-dependent methyltransferase
MLREAIKATPIVGPALRKLLARIRKRRFSSKRYWDERYRQGGNSGAGSYGKLADFKAEVINRFIREYGVQSVVEFGCGDGNQLSLLRCNKYVGLDVSRRAIQVCRERFAADPSKRFAVYGSGSAAPGAYLSDLALSLDVIFHLVEDDVFTAYMRTLFENASRLVIVYSDDRDLEYLESIEEHVRHRKFTDWIGANCPAWRLLEHIPNRFPLADRFSPDGKTGSGSFADFWIYERKS